MYHLMVQADALMPDTENDPELTSIFESDVDYNNQTGGAQTIESAVTNGNTPSTGSAKVIVEYYTSSNTLIQSVFQGGFRPPLLPESTGYQQIQSIEKTELVARRKQVIPATPSFFNKALGLYDFWTVE